MRKEKPATPPILPYYIKYEFLKNTIFAFFATCALVDSLAYSDKHIRKELNLFCEDLPEICDSITDSNKENFIAEFTNEIFIPNLTNALVSSSLFFLIAFAQLMVESSIHLINDRDSRTQLCQKILDEIKSLPSKCFKYNSKKSNEEIPLIEKKKQHIQEEPETDEEETVDIIPDSPQECSLFRLFTKPRHTLKHSLPNVPFFIMTTVCATISVFIFPSWSALDARNNFSPESSLLNMTGLNETEAQRVIDFGEDLSLSIYQIQAGATALQVGILLFCAMVGGCLIQANRSTLSPTMQ